jgi:hypothetical protein
LRDRSRGHSWRQASHRRSIGSLITPVSKPAFLGVFEQRLGGCAVSLAAHGVGDWLITPLPVFTPVMMADMPLAESETKSNRPARSR